MKTWLCLFLTIALTGCAALNQRTAPDEAPPTPEATDYLARRLDGQGLGAYMREHAGRAGSTQGDRWDLDALTLAAFYYHPDLTIARARLGVVTAGETTAAARPNPRIGFQPRYSLNTPAGASPWLFIFDLEWPFETADKRTRRLDRARLATASARLELATVGWQVRSRLRRAYLTYLTAGRERDLLAAEAAVRAELLGLLETRLALGDAVRPEVQAVRLDLNRARFQLELAEGRAAQAREALAASIGVPTGALAGVPLASAWPERQPPALEPTALRAEALINRVDLRQALADYEVADATVRLEGARQTPDFSLGPSFRYRAGEPQWQLGIAAPLPVLNQNEGPIAEALALLQEAAARFYARQAVVLAEVGAAIAQVRAARQARRAADRLVTAAEDRERTMRQLLSLGDADRVASVGARLEVALARQSREQAIIAEQSALSALEDALHKPLSAVSTPPLERMRP